MTYTEALPGLRPTTFTGYSMQMSGKGQMRPDNDHGVEPMRKSTVLFLLHF